MTRIAALATAALSLVVAVGTVAGAESAPACGSDATDVPTLSVELVRAPVLKAGREVPMSVRVTRGGHPVIGAYVETSLVGQGWEVSGSTETEEDGQALVRLRLPRRATGEVDAAAAADNRPVRLPCMPQVRETGATAAAWGRVR